VLVPVTRMFRDEAEFGLLERVVLPELLERGRRLDIWSAGCANGDELRSVAALLDRLGGGVPRLLVGSDLLEEELERAYELVAACCPDGRSAFRFERRDLVLDGAPARRFDLVLCRNVAIYLERPARSDLHEKLVSALRPGGFLMLGASETLLQPQRLGLEAVGRHVFRRVGA
jgi:chemotaxis protein methyltransferase CheR